MEIRTRRWTRSPRGCILGVATGLAEWRGLPINLTRLPCSSLGNFNIILPCNDHLSYSRPASSGAEKGRYHQRQL